MSKYLIFGGGVLCGIILVVVGVFVYLQMVINSSIDPQVIPADTASDVVIPKTEDHSTNPTPSTSAVDDTGPLLTEPIPLSRLPLTETQKQLVSGLGIDYDTFMITPDMATCAEGKLGRARVGELIAGSAPSFSEVAVLARCL